LPRAYRGIPDAALYAPLYSPWKRDEFQVLYAAIQDFTLVGPDRAWVLYTLSRQAMAVSGAFVECGVYRGGTAVLMAKVLEQSGVAVNKPLHLFDTFCGMPQTTRGVDLHKAGDFADTNAAAVRARLPPRITCELHAGVIPQTFAALTDLQVAFAHIDLDIYRAVLDSCEFLYPRMTRGGFMVFDDYGFASCPGARSAVDEFFANKPENPLCLSTGQALVFRN